MELRARITAEMKQAMKDKATARLSTIRLINAAIKDRDIAVRSDGNHDGVDDTEVLAILGKMVRQRQESARTYEEASRLDLSERELSEITVIEEFLPRQLSAEEVAVDLRFSFSFGGFPCGISQSCRDFSERLPSDQKKPFFAKTCCASM